MPATWRESCSSSSGRSESEARSGGLPEALQARARLRGRPCPVAGRSLRASLPSALSAPLALSPSGLRLPARPALGARATPRDVLGVVRGCPPSEHEPDAKPPRGTAGLCINASTNQGTHSLHQLNQLGRRERARRPQDDRLMDGDESVRKSHARPIDATARENHPCRWPPRSGGILIDSFFGRSAGRPVRTSRARRRVDACSTEDR